MFLSYGFIRNATKFVDYNICRFSLIYQNVPRSVGRLDDMSPSYLSFFLYFCLNRTTVFFIIINDGLSIFETKNVDVY